MTVSKLRCPVCEEDFETKTDHIEGTTCEEHGTCEDEYHKYVYGYAYGHTQEHFSFVEIHHSYNFDKEAREHYAKTYDAIVKIEREQYLKAKGASK